MHWSFGPSLHRHYNGFFATTASADFSSTLMQEISPGKVQNLSPRADWLYLMRLDDLWASLFGASLPPAPGLTASSCPYGREFATRFFRLRLAATPCVSLRLPSSAPIGSFHPIRFCPCWAHASGHYRSRHRLSVVERSIRRITKVAGENRAQKPPRTTNPTAPATGGDFGFRLQRPCSRCHR